MRNNRRTLRAWGLPLLCGLTTLAFAACDASERDASEELPEPRIEQPRDEVSFDGADHTLDQAPEDSVHVKLTDTAIDMPQTLPAGPLALHVMNEGTKPLNVEIESMGVSERLATEVPPGGSSTMVVDLQPGTVQVRSPVAGMTAKIKPLQVKVQ